MFNSILEVIISDKSLDFEEKVCKIENIVNGSSNFISILEEIGIIPECIKESSTEEKIFSKASDIVLSRAFIELGLESYIIKKRGNSADVFAKSNIYNYTLVADAKSFRMSRTAKNQKDFKINSLANWKDGSDYSVLCSPYFQYPKKKSQIYFQAMEYNVCLLSWEHLIFLIKNNIKENSKVDLSKIWNFSYFYSSIVCVKDRNERFLEDFNKIFYKEYNIDTFSKILQDQKISLNNRALKEISFINEEINIIKKLSREEAIEYLLKHKKLKEKIDTIKSFIEKDVKI